MADRGSFDTNTKKFLKLLHSQQAWFYLFPKIHKPNNPGKPIISLCDAPTEKISEFIDHHLRPLVEQLPSYLRDTTHFLHKLQELSVLLPGILLVTLDVKSLYTNFPHNDGIKSCKERLNTKISLQPTTKDVVELVRQILTKNYLTFAGKHYLRNHGTALDTRMAPS